ncbi:MAG: NAD(P)H-hydrate dehydratase [Myxococcota bacterium]
MLKSIASNVHKGSFPHVAIFEGSIEKRGASRMAAYAALRAGAGLVTLLVADPLHNVPGDMPEFMKRTAFDTDLTGFSIVVMGPGLASRDKMVLASTIFKAALHQNVPMILDAGALELLSELTADDKSDSIIIATPHPGEAGRLLGVSAEVIQQDRVGALNRLLEISNRLPVKVIWVLKGANTMVADGDRRHICEGDCPALAVGGSGDVLGGAIAGLWGRADDAFDCARIGVVAHFAAGRMLSAKSPRGHFASEIADQLPVALMQG